MKVSVALISLIILSTGVHTVSAESLEAPIIGVIPRTMFYEYKQLVDPIVEKCERTQYKTRYLITAKQNGVLVTINEKGDIETNEQESFIREFWKCNIIVDSTQGQTISEPRKITIPKILIQEYDELSEVLNKSINVCVTDDEQMIFSLSRGFGYSGSKTYFDSSGEEIGRNSWNDYGISKESFDTSGLTCDTLVYENKYKKFNFASTETTAVVNNLPGTAKEKSSLLILWNHFMAFLGF